MDYRGTEFQRDVESGAFEDQVVALLRREADNWQVTKWGLGGTDVYWLQWDKTYGAPSEILGPFEMGASTSARSSPTRGGSGITTVCSRPPSSAAETAVRCADRSKALAVIGVVYASSHEGRGSR